MTRIEVHPHIGRQMRDGRIIEQIDLPSEPVPVIEFGTQILIGTATISLEENRLYADVNLHNGESPDFASLVIDAGSAVFENELDEDGNVITMRMVSGDIAAVTTYIMTEDYYDEPDS